METPSDSEKRQGVETAAMDVLWDDDEDVVEGEVCVNGDAAAAQVESVFGGQDSRWL